MPCWFYDKKDFKNTPSVKDGISCEKERRYRKEGARFVLTCGLAMSLGHNTIATGAVYFHRFYMFHSFRTFPRYVTACCCLLLAGKVEETPKKCRDIIKTARSLLTDDQFYSFGDDPKEEVMTLERILLQTIKFDLQIEHPFGFLVKYAKCFKNDQAKLQKMVQMAWNFVNDSLSTTVCLQWEPEIVAVALIHLATKLSRFSVSDWVGRQPHHTRWWDVFVSNVTMDILEDICHQVLDLYQPGQEEVRDTPSPPQKPPSKASPPPVKRPITPQPSTSKNSVTPIIANTSGAVKNNQNNTSENNLQATSALSASSSSSTKIYPIESVPPTRIYPQNYGNNIYPSGSHTSSNHGSIASGPAPPPPQPPLYGAQFGSMPQIPPHYSGSSSIAGPPPLGSHHTGGGPSGSHYPPVVHHHHPQPIPPPYHQPIPSHHTGNSSHHSSTSASIHHAGAGPPPPSNQHHSSIQPAHHHHPSAYYGSNANHNRNYYPP